MRRLEAVNAWFGAYFWTCALGASWASMLYEMQAGHWLQMTLATVAMFIAGGAAIVQDARGKP